MDERCAADEQFRDLGGIADNAADAPPGTLTLDEARRRDGILRHVVRAVRDELQPEGALTAILAALGLALTATGGLVLRHSAGGPPRVAASWGAKPPAAALAALRAGLERDSDLALAHGSAQLAAQTVIYRAETKGALLLWRCGAPEPFSAVERTLLGEVADHLAQVYEKRGQKDEAMQTFALGIVAVHSVPETRGRLVALLGPGVKESQIDELLAKARPELSKLRSYPVGKLLNEKADADFLVLLSPGEKDAKVEEVRFVNGSEKLRPFAANLRSLHFAGMFPDASPVKLVRRGTLSCSAATGGCIFVLLLPEDVRTVN